MNNRSRLSQEEYTVFFSDFLDCNSARGIDDLLFILFWSFPSSVISVYFVLFHRFVAHLYVYARLVTTFLYLFLVFFLSIFTAFSYLHDSFLFMPVQILMKVVSLYQVDSEHLRSILDHCF